VCRASPQEAWAALLEVPRWLGALDTVDDVDAPGDVAVSPGAQLDVLSQERMRLVWRIGEVAPGRRVTAVVRWRRLLRIDVVYEIEPHPEGCELVHSRAYRGPVTRAMATVWRLREEEEQTALLREWCWEAGSIAALRRYAS